MKTGSIRNREKAQILPLLVIGILVVIIMAALLVDGSNLLSNRRSAQAAADAGALAGAKVLCEGYTSAIQTAAAARAGELVGLNGATLISTEIVPIDISGYNVTGIKVSASVENASFFSRILGEDELKAVAVATAGCFHPSLTTHVLPIAFYYQTPPVNASDADCQTNETCDLVNWDYWELLDTLRATPKNNLPLDDIYVIMNEIKICEKVTGAIVCADMKKNVEGGDRSWIDLSEVADVNNLKMVIKEGIDNPLALPAWINGKPGVDAAVFNGTNFSQLPLIENYEDLNVRLVLVPVFDYFCNKGDPEHDCPAKWDADDSVEYISNPNKPSYRLIGLAPFVVTCVTKNEKVEFGDSIKVTIKGKKKDVCPGWYHTGMTESDAIEGYFADSTPLDAFVSGTQGVDVGLDVISLYK